MNHEPDNRGNIRGENDPSASDRNSGLTPAARLRPTCESPARQFAHRTMDRFWFLTWTTYGTWLPGDDRGFVSNIDRGDGKGQRRNRPGTEPASQMRGLSQMAEQSMKGPPVFLDSDRARVLLEQIQETAKHRGWQLQAVAIMRNHVHLVVGVPGDPEPESLLRDFKSYGSRALNRRWPRPLSDTWWTESGSRRKLPNERAIAGAVAYVLDQRFPLVVWIDPSWVAELGRRDD